MGRSTTPPEVTIANYKKYLIKIDTFTTHQKTVIKQALGKATDLADANTIIRRECKKLKIKL